MVEFNHPTFIFINDYLLVTSYFFSLQIGLNLIIIVNNN